MLDVKDNLVEKKSLFSECLRLTGIGACVVPLFDNKKIATREIQKAGYATLDDLRKGQIMSIETLRYWFGGDNPRRGLGLITDRIICLDFDSGAAYHEFRDRWPIFSYSWTQRSPKGYHIYYQVKNALDGNFSVSLPDVELKHGGAIVACHYPTIDNGLPNRYTLLAIRDVATLPIVSMTPKKRTFFSTELKQSTSIDNPIKRIRRCLPIYTYLERLGHKLHPYQNGTYSAKCPLHSDTKPSFWISKSGQICNCHSCGGDLPMDIINLHQKLNHCTTSQAISDLLRLI